MKEATGELNMTVITVVAIAAVGALFTFFVWPAIQGSLMLNTACSNVSTEGNYHPNASGGTKTTSTGAANDKTKDGTIDCTNFTCTATYNGRTYTKNCNE